MRPGKPSATITHSLAFVLHETFEESDIAGFQAAAETAEPMVDALPSFLKSLQYVELARLSRRT